MRFFCKAYTWDGACDGNKGFTKVEKVGGSLQSFWCYMQNNIELGIFLFKDQKEKATGWKALKTRDRNLLCIRQGR